MLKCLNPLKIFSQKFGRVNVKMKKGGFTLIELLAVIFVIIVGVVGIIALIQQTISFMALSSSKLIASYLAQEGMEIVRNIRDGNWLEEAEEGWKEGLFQGDYEADYNAQSLTVCSLPCDYDNNLRFLGISDSGFYNYDLGNLTKFKRKISIAPPSGGVGAINDPFKVSVSVVWMQFGKQYEVTAEEHLYNWR